MKIEDVLLHNLLLVDCHVTRAKRCVVIVTVWSLHTWSDVGTIGAVTTLV